METGGEKNQWQEASANESAASGTSARPSTMNSMSLYERQAVQALQALQRQPHAAQYFQQLMLQQHINKAQLQNLAAVQQASLAVGRQPGPSSAGPAQTASTSVASVTSGSASAASSCPVGVSATTTISQSVLLSGGPGGRGQMYLRVNRSLRAPISSQLIFMPGNTASAAVATVPQLPQPQKQEVVTTSSSSCQTDGDQVQNLAVRGVSGLKGVKTEKGDAAAYSLVQSTPQSPNKAGQPQLPPIKIPTYPQPTNLKAPPPSSSSGSASSSVPLSQLFLHGTRTLATGPAASATAHALVLTSTAASQARAYSVGRATIKPAVAAQTLVVQPLQKSSLGGDKLGHGNGPVPIQPKTLQGLRLPLQLPSRNPLPIMPAPPPASGSTQTPHIPIQIVGARQSTLGSGQALALARGGCNQEGAAILASSSSLLTVVASIASREGGVIGAGVGVKAPSQETPPVPLASKVCANQSQNGPLAVSPASCQSATVSSPASLPPRAPLPLPTNGDSAASPTAQVKHASGSLKRKLEEDGPSPLQLLPIRGGASALTGVSMETVSAPPPASPSLPVSRGARGRIEKAPPPQAVVKPHVLTHLIEGFVIQEGAEPFPVCRPIKDSAEEDESVAMETVLECEYCKKLAPASQFGGSKRFCSLLCAKRYNVSFRQPLRMRQARDRNPLLRQGHRSRLDDEGGVARRRVPRRTSSEIASAKIAGRPLPVTRRSKSSRSDTESSGEEDEDDIVSPSPASSASCHAKETSTLTSPPSSPAHWSVDQVSQFISSLQGCEELASHFLSQEIDGQALLLLKEEHLVSTMNIKLGPALKICAHINNLRD
ncbi:polyhomeotic-like protein 1 isoform X2 [Dunckerocampus dactyliophorus]|uniref:polyhomeotic-like protein 1 isoform X2 n=1 Tax=Dunckerocampus dactyliophorus TaxID=161453 RepID=UPI0024063712|nr:polyhomeotic-like protein 1 isoform X2 [Dunckerocampus dactyliophorus]